MQSDGMKKPAAASLKSAPRRSEATRSRLLAAARVLFARDGYERTTVRAVAVAAAADPALVMRYFGSKEGLFAAATVFDLRLPSLAGLPPERVGEVMIQHFLARWEGDPDDRSLRILLRAGVTHPEAAERIRTLFAEQVLPVIRGVAPDRAALRAGLVASQILGLALCRFILLVPPVEAMPAEALIAHVGPTLQRYLTAPLEDAFTA
jgi:AcrR family transcriptional regulator